MNLVYPGKIGGGEAMEVLEALEEFLDANSIDKESIKRIHGMPSNASDYDILTLMNSAGCDLIRSSLDWYDTEEGGDFWAKIDLDWDLFFYENLADKTFFKKAFYEFEQYRVVKTQSTAGIF